jgi:hypothetical protein
MPEFSAAMGLVSLAALDDIVAVNRRNWELYRLLLSDVPGLRFLAHDPDVSNYQYVVLEVEEAATGISRDALCEFLWDRNVRARRYFAPGCHLMEPYRSMFPDVAPVPGHRTARLLHHASDGTTISDVSDLRPDSEGISGLIAPTIEDGRRNASCRVSGVSARKEPVVALRHRRPCGQVAISSM